MRATLRMTAVLAVIALACLSTVHFAVTDSWYSDIESVEVRIEMGDSDASVSSSFVIDDGKGLRQDGSYEHSEGDHSIEIIASEVSFTIDGGSLILGGVTYDSGIIFSVPQGSSVPYTIGFEVVTNSTDSESIVVLSPVRR